MVAAHHGAIGIAVQHSPPGHDHPERAIAPLVGRHVGGGQRFHRIVDRRAGDEVRGVHGPSGLGIGAAEVERGPVPALVDAHVDADGAVIDAVVVEPVLALPDSVGQSPERRPHLHLGLRVQALEAGLEPLGAVALAELGQAARGDVARRVLGEEIALALVAPAQVRQDEIDGVALRTLGREEPDGGDAQPLLMAFGGGRHVAAGHGAPDIRPVSEAHREGDQAALEEHRPHRLDVGQVIAADLGQVEVPHVAVLHPLRGHALEQLLDGEAHHAHMHRDVAALGDETAPGVGEGRGEVARLLEQRRARRAHDDHAHLLGDGVEPVADDFERHRIGPLRAHRPVSMRRLPSGSAVARWPGYTTVVDHSSSITAGPAMVCPAGSAARA